MANDMQCFLINNGDPWLTIGPNYIFSLILFLFVTGLGVVLMGIISKAQAEYWYFKIVGMLLILFCYLALAFTVLLNPGHPSNAEKYKQLPHSQM